MGNQAVFTEKLTEVLLAGRKNLGSGSGTGSPFVKKRKDPELCSRVDF
jgi:hypothetical protein